MSGGDSNEIKSEIESLHDKIHSLTETVAALQQTVNMLLCRGSDHQSSAPAPAAAAVAQPETDVLSKKYNLDEANNYLDEFDSLFANSSVEELNGLEMDYSKGMPFDLNQSSIPALASAALCALISSQVNKPNNPFSRPDLNSSLSSPQPAQENACNI